MKLLSLLFAFLFALSLTWIVGNRKGDVWEEKIRVFTYRQLLHKNVPATYYVQLDTFGVPYVDYVDDKGKLQAKRYMPTTVALYALQYADTLRTKPDDLLLRKKFFHCLQALTDSLTTADGYSLYIHHFQQTYYPKVKRPWCSGLPSGKAVEAFMAAYALTGDSLYLSYCDNLLRGYYVPIERGGFTYREADGWWYEEYADTARQTPRVANGHLYALLSTYRFWELTKRDSAHFVFEQGLRAWKRDLPLYDAPDGWVYYDKYRKQSDKHYQRAMVELMDTLYGLTGDKFFAHYRQKWNKPLAVPYFLRVFQERNRSGGLLLSACFVISFVVAGFFTTRLLSCFRWLRTVK